MMLVVWVLLIIVLSIMGLMIYSLTRGSEWLPFVSRDIDESVDEHTQSQDDAVFHYFERKAGYEDIISLDDEDYDFTYKNLKEVIFYGKSYQHKYGEWTSSVLWLYQQLFDLDPQPLFDLADDPNEAYFVRIDDKNNRKIDDGLYVFLNTDTNTKIKVLRRVVDRYPLNEGEVNDDIVFVINNDNNDS